MGSIETADATIHDQVVADDYGINWYDPLNVEYENAVNLDDINCPLEQNQLENLKLRLEELGFATADLTPWLASERYRIVKEYVHEMHEI